MDIVVDRNPEIVPGGAAVADERFWAEVKARLDEMERRRRMRDRLSADEQRALISVAGAPEQIAKSDAQAQEQALSRPAAVSPAAANAETDLAFQLERAIEYAAAHPQQPREPKRIKDSRDGTARPATATLALSLAIAFALGVGLFWLQPATPKTAAPSHRESAQSTTEAGRQALQKALMLKMDADSAEFAARAAAGKTR